MAILLHTIRKYKLKTFASSEQNQSQNVSKDDNSTYGVMELKFNGAYDYKPKSELDHHVYEEIGAF